MTCQKCKGLMVKEWRPDFSQHVAVFRCINCGLVLDPLIAQNRVTALRAKQPVSECSLNSSFKIMSQFGRCGRLAVPTELGRCGRCARG